MLLQCRRPTHQSGNRWNADQAKKSRGLKGKIIENKKEEMADYVDKAVEKIKAYLPPDPEKIQQIYGAGKVSIQILEPGKKFKLGFPEYVQQGDNLSISLDKVNQKAYVIGCQHLH